jgi:hypothetical protein
MVIQDE